VITRPLPLGLRASADFVNTDGLPGNQLAVFISIGFNHTTMISPLLPLVFIFDFNFNFVGQRTQVPGVSRTFLCPAPRPPRAWAGPRPRIGKLVVGTGRELALVFGYGKGRGRSGAVGL